MDGPFIEACVLSNLMVTCREGSNLLLRKITRYFPNVGYLENFTLNVLMKIDKKAKSATFINSHGIAANLELSKSTDYFESQLDKAGDHKKLAPLMTPEQWSGIPFFIRYIWLKTRRLAVKPTSSSVAVDKGVSGDAPSSPNIYIIDVSYNYSLKFNHQGLCMFLPASNKVLFYEPYGTYKKYNISYVHVLEAVAKQLFPKATFEVFHRAINRFDEGLQIQIVSNNASNQEAFFAKYNAVKDKFRRLFGKEFVPDPRDPDDPDIAIGVLDLVSKTLIESRAKWPRTTAMSDGELQMFTDLLASAYTIYGEHCAKTCVTITLVELYHFLAVFSGSADKRGVLGGVDLYQGMNPKKPTAHIVAELRHIIYRMYPTETACEIFTKCSNIVNDRSFSALCKGLTGRR